MTTILAVAQCVFYTLLGSLFAVIVVQVLDGRINTHHLFSGKWKGGGYYTSPERIQLFAFTAWTAINYLKSVMDNPFTGVLPDVSDQTLYLLGGSHFLYLGGKTYAMIFAKQKDNS